MIAIKDMEMPKSCTECEMTHEDRYSCDLCDFTGSDVTYEIRKNLKHSDCPLVEIVTCEDCKHRRGNVCRSFRHLISDDFFCADGERKE